MKYPILKLIVLVVFSSTAMSAAASKVFYNVMDFGAAGDGVAIDTPAIEKAITAASENGGGTVFFPAGDYLSVTIYLQNNIRLYLDHGATLIAHDGLSVARFDLPEPNAYDMYQDFGHSHFRNGLIYGEGLENITIEGSSNIQLDDINGDPSGTGMGSVEMK